MKKIIKLLLLIGIISIIQGRFLGGFAIKNDLLANIVTFLSIIFGFYITSLAVFSGSRYIASLYSVTDKANKSRTLLHAIMENFKFGLTYVLFSIAYFIFIQLFVVNYAENGAYLSNKLLWPFLGVLIGNIWYAYKMLNDLIKVVVQEAKNAN